MIGSRGLAAIRAAKLLSRNNLQSTQSSRPSSHGWYYRIGAEVPSKNIHNIATAVQGFAWWWVLWHTFTEPDHIYGEFPYPDPNKWTDEELGVPA